MKLKILDLFSGLGGFSLGLERTGKYKTVAFCEIDKYCTLLLQKHWKGVKIYNDVKKITKEGFEADGIESPDIITGGFPCQPFSVAGKQKGTSDDRHLWPEMFRIIKAFKPRFVIGENVPGIVNIQDGVVFETVCTDLESQGYEVQPFNIPASAVGAPHQRKRIWIIAILGDSKYNGSSTNKIGRGNEEINEWTKKRQNSPFEFERTSRFKDNETMENSRRTLQQGTELFNTNEDEIRKENANQHQRSSSPSESNVANANESISREREISRNSNDERRGTSEARGESLQSEDRKTRTDNIGSSSEDVANTKLQRLQGRQRNDKREGRQILSSEQHDRREIRSEIGCSSGVSRQEDVANAECIGQQGSRESIRPIDTETNENRQTNRFDSSSEEGKGWWDTEPNVGRVAHGVSGRVHRLKGLGNSIIPQIVEEIGYAIIKAERTK